jgi:hypothetical protein
MGFRKKDKMKLFLVGLALPISLFLTACSDNLQPADVAQRYLDFIRTGTYTQAYDMLTSDSQLKISRSEYIDRLNRARQDAGITGPTLVKVNRDPVIVGKRASVSYELEITLQSGQKLPLFEALVLLQQDSGWRVVWPPL